MKIQHYKSDTEKQITSKQQQQQQRNHLHHHQIRAINGVFVELIAAGEMCK